jgi:hypothetical protein
LPSTALFPASAVVLGLTTTTPLPVLMNDCVVGLTSLEASVDCVPHRSNTIAVNHCVPLVGATVLAVDEGFWYS